MGGTAVAASAVPSDPTEFLNEDFTGASAGSAFLRPTMAGTTNTACLTAGSSTSTTSTSTIPGCQSPAINPAGSGALRLTRASTNQAGAVGAVASVPATQGLVASFDSYQWGGTAAYGSTADGIAFYLTATDPYEPSPPQQTGASGGTLGYSPGSQNGVARAYLGIGLDVFGSFSGGGADGSGCTPQPQTAETVVVRGPGNNRDGYCRIAALTGFTGLLNNDSASSRTSARVPVEVVINTTSSTMTSPEGVSVPAGRFAITFTPLGGPERTLTGTLPNVTNTPAMSGYYPAGWINPTTGYPYKLAFGWAASTGAATATHEISNVGVQTLAGAVPVLGATVPGPAVVQPLSSGSYVVTPQVTSAGGSEAELIRITTTFPAGLTPSAAGSGSGWSCTRSGQTATCDHDPTTPIAPGTTLPAVSMPYTTGGTPMTATISSVVSSLDAEAVTVSQQIRVPAETVEASGSDVTGQYGQTRTFTASVHSISTPATTPTGTIAFEDATTGGSLCTATLSPASTATAEASCTASLPGPAGAHVVRIAYSGDASHEPLAGDDRGTLALTVDKASTTPAGVVDDPVIVHSASTVFRVSGLPGAATGTVDFVDADDAVLCTATLPATSCSAGPALGSGAYQVHARYSGDALYAASDSAAIAFRVDPEPVTATGPDVSGEYGQTRTFAASVRSTATPGTAPTGTVTFQDATSGDDLCTATLDASGDGSCAATLADPIGAHEVRIAYGGDADHDALSGTARGTLALTVSKITSTLSAEPDEPTIVHSASTTLSATGLPVTATGTVEFVDADDVVLCTAVLPAVSCDAGPALASGSYDVRARYSGDAHHAASVSPDFALVVEPESVTVTAEDVAGEYGQSRVLSASVASGAVPGSVPSGEVTFFDETTGEDLCTATLDAHGDASCTAVLAEPIGAHVVRIAYSGDDGHETLAAADGGELTLTVGRISSSPTATPGAARLAFDGTTSLFVGDLPEGATGTVAFVDAEGTVLCTVTLPALACTMSAPLPPGSHLVRARYSGDALHLPMDSLPFTLVVDPEPRPLAVTGGTGVEPVVPVAGAVAVLAGFVVLMVRLRRARR